MVSKLHVRAASGSAKRSRSRPKRARQTGSSNAQARRAPSSSPSLTDFLQRATREGQEQVALARDRARSLLEIGAGQPANLHLIPQGESRAARVRDQRIGNPAPRSRVEARPWSAARASCSRSGTRDAVRATAAGPARPAALPGDSASASGVVRMSTPSGFSTEASVRTKPIGDGTCSTVSDDMTTSQRKRFASPASR